MKTLNQALHQTSHRSSLVRKAERFGFVDVGSLVQLAAQRGCYHYRNTLQNREVCDPGKQALSNEELVTLLLHGNYPYTPMAIRCAAQLLKSEDLNPELVVFLAHKERCLIVLHYIAQQGKTHDHEGRELWERIIASISKPLPQPEEGILPHVSRFMINPGIQRGGPKPPHWLTPVVNTRSE